MHERKTIERRNLFYLVAMLHLYLRTKNEHNAALRLDATVKCIKVVEKCSFQTNELIFGLRSKLIIVMIVHIFNCCCTIVYAPSDRPSNPDRFSCRRSANLPYSHHVINFRPHVTACSSCCGEAGWLLAA